MTPWPPISRDDLKHAAATAGFDMTLPLLVRRLIAETADGLKDLDMPGGSGTATGGFDGVVVAADDTIDVPAGTSVWELSVTNKAQAKADDDYSRRLAAPDGHVMSSVTYIQVILAPWTKSRSWAAARTRERRWNEVRAYNLDKIHGWLERAPATTVWLAEQLGKSLPGVRPLGQWLHDTWLPSTRIPLEARYVLAGRGDEAKGLLTALEDGQAAVTIGGDLPPDELRAFVASALESEKSPAPSSLGARTVHVTDAHTLAQLVRQPQPLVILLADASLAVDLPLNHPHQLIIPGVADAACDLLVPRVDGQEISQLLRSEGEAWERASALGTLGRRSLLALRRSLANTPAALIPSWARRPDLLRRRTALIGAWDGRSSADRNAVADCIGVPYDEVQEQTLQLAATPEAPMLGQVNEQWHVLAPDDSWMLLSPYLTQDDVEAFLTTVRVVLRERNSLLGLNNAERLSAQMEGVGPAYSPTLRQGLARTLALLGRTDDPLPTSGQRSGSDQARGVVHTLLEEANSDGSYSLWTSLTDVLTLIAEAAPDVFLEAIRAGLAGHRPLHAQMFTDRVDASDALSRGRSPHTAFLWALEILAWSEEYFDETIDLLGRLAAIDPGGSWANRPDRSLNEILSCWRPNTSASQDRRLRALRRLMQIEPDVGRRTLLDLIPHGHGFQTDHPSPRYRDWRRDVPVTRAEMAETVSAVVDMLLDDLDTEPSRFIALVDKIDHVAPRQRAAFVEHLKSLGNSLEDDGERRRLWEALRTKVANHREYADAQWALPEDELRLLDEGLAAVAPKAPSSAAAWLFESDWIALGDMTRREDYDAYEAALLERRTTAIGRVLDEGGLESVLELAAGTSYPHLVGVALAEHTPDLDDEMVQWLSEDQRRQQVSYAYVARRLRQTPDAVNEVLSATSDVAAQAMILRGTSNPPLAWEKLERLPQPVAKAYWKHFSYVGLGDFKHIGRAVAGLLGVHRYAAAIDLIALYERRADYGADIAEQAAAALEGLLAGGLDDPEFPIVRSHDYRAVFALLARHVDVIGKQRAVNLEWQFFPALGLEANAPALHTALAEDPAFFVEVISYLYRREDGADVEVNDADGDMADEQRRLLAGRAFEVLRSWRRCPGTSEGGTIDPSLLNEWVQDARTRLAAEGRLTSGDQEIGQVMPFAPPDPDGMFPPRCVRDLFEMVRSDNIESGFRMGLYNKRGVTSRGLFDGGQQEWDLAREAREASEASGDWPRTQRLMRAVALGYERDARREDLKAERRRRGLPD